MKGMQRRNKRGRRRRIDYRRFFLFIVFMIICVASLSMLVRYVSSSAQRRQQNERLSQEYADAFVQGESSLTEDSEVETHLQPAQAPQPDLLENYRRLSGTIPEMAQKLYRQNSDLVGWLYIKGVVNLPVVYRDNEYYLNHNFNQEADNGGTLFLDQYHPLNESTQHLVIHGHNMYDSSMFGIVRTYDKLSMVKEHPFARFSTMYAPEDYVIFSVVRLNPDVNSSRYFSYIGRPRFGSVDEFSSYIGSLRQRSIFEIPIDVKPSDSLLTLSTCIGEDRLIVVFRRIRNGETREQLQSLVEQSFKR